MLRPIVDGVYLSYNWLMRDIPTFCGLCRVPLPIANPAFCPFLTCPQRQSGAAMTVADTARMSGKEFELYVRDQLMRLEGYINVELTRESGDMGADLVVRHKGKIIVVQCKRYAGTVGLQAVQEVLGAKSFYAADEAWVITDSTFTKAARNLAKKANVRLRTLRTKK